MYQDSDRVWLRLGSYGALGAALIRAGDRRSHRRVLPPQAVFTPPLPASQLPFGACVHVCLSAPPHDSRNNWQKSPSEAIVSHPSPLAVGVYELCAFDLWRVGDGAPGPVRVVRVHAVEPRVAARPRRRAQLAPRTSSSARPPSSSSRRSSHNHDNNSHIVLDSARLAETTQTRAKHVLDSAGPK